MTDTVLTDEQVESFVEHGHVTLPGCFTREDARPLLDEAWIRLGYDPHDPAPGRAARPHAQPAPPSRSATSRPRCGARPASCSAARSASSSPTRWGNGFIANLGLGADRDWEPPSASQPGWHKDGDFFRHFLDSPEQGLLTIVLWSDIEPRGGGTFVAADSVAPVARLLAEHRDGILPDDFDYDALDRAVHELHGYHGPPGPRRPHAPRRLDAGLPVPSRHGPVHHQPADHPERAHALRPADPAEHSPVERAVLRALGIERLDYRPRPRARASSPSGCCPDSSG